jgi:hypothetical protein
MELHRIVGMVDTETACDLSGGALLTPKWQRRSQKNSNKQL